MTILTGDTHGDFSRIMDFCEIYETSLNDVMVILGDAGINYYLDERDVQLKEELSCLSITLFCVHGNHEERPENISGYQERRWHGGIVYYEPNYPNLLFARDGEIYDLNGKRVLAIGGAYSIDRDYRIANGQPWFESEQPGERTKQRVEERLDKANWTVDCVFSHTVPLGYMPRHTFLPNVDQSGVDWSTERWLERIEKKLNYERWYAGHFHVTEWRGRLCILFEDYEELL